MIAERGAGGAKECREEFLDVAEPGWRWLVECIEGEVGRRRVIRICGDWIVKRVLIEVEMLSEF
jgi:hypothetical protein